MEGIRHSGTLSAQAAATRCIAPTQVYPIDIGMASAVAATPPLMEAVAAPQVFACHKTAESLPCQIYEARVPRPFRLHRHRALPQRSQMAARISTLSARDVLPRP